VTDQLLGLLSLYGVPALFSILAVASVGLPFPISLVLVAAGSFVEQGEMKLWQVLTFGAAGAVLGDQIGYWVGRKGGRELVEWITDRIGGAASVKRAEAVNRRWGWAAVFFTRWLATPLGPWINLSSGVSRYSWRRFLIWDALGEILWVVIYVSLGRLFSDRVQELSQLLGNMAWVVIGITASVFLGWKTVSYLRRPALKTAS
jgi:membrane-associated protein